MAPFLLPSAGPEFRQSRGAEGRDGRSGFLAGHGRGWAAAGRRALSVRTRRYQLRELAGDARVLAQVTSPRGQEVSGAHASRGSEPVAGGRRRLLRRRRRVPHGLPFPDHAAAVHGASDGGQLPDPGHLGANTGDPRVLPVGHLPTQPRRAHAGNGHGRRAGLHGPRLRARSSDAHQRWHPAAAGPAARKQPAAHRADERAPVLPAGNAGALLRRRDRHGGQRLPWRSQRGAHAHAVEPGSQRRLFEIQSAEAVFASDHGSGVPLRSGQRRNPAAEPQLALVVDQAPDRPAQAVRCFRPRNLRATPAREPQGARLRPPLGRRGHLGGGELGAVLTIRGARPVGVPRARADGAVR